MTIQPGERLPSTTFIKAGPDGPEQVESDSFFAGRKIVLFAVPGAFTPTCSARHLPGFVEKASEIRSRGVDEIACTAVNDAFVMQAWAEQNNAQDIVMLADGNGDFARAIGLAMDNSKFGMGERSRRYVMLVEDGVVKQLHVEEPGAFNVSSADYLLENL